MTSWICLTDEQLDQLYHGRASPEDLKHVFVCPACRARLLLLRDAMDESQAVEVHEELALAAKGVKDALIRSLSTEDESLVCRIEREPGQDSISVTVLADRQAWGDVVVIWPGAGEPLLVPVGETVRSRAGDLAVIGLWQVSRAEATWVGEWSELPPQLDGTNASIALSRHGDTARLSSTSPVVSVTAYHDGRKWKVLNLPQSLPMAGQVKLRLFTPLSAVPLQ